MRIPVATYRLQFSTSFRFADAEKLLVYLNNLGISDIYASPIFQATGGSTHGYDQTDPNRLNPELGSEQDFGRLMRKIKKLQMGWLQDIVPNHMAYTSENTLLADVFERGRCSRYFSFFDIVWDHPDPVLRGKVLAPFLGKSLRESLRADEIKLTLSPAGLSVNYYEHRFGLLLSTYSEILHPEPPAAQATAEKLDELAALCKSFDRLATEQASDATDQSISRAKQKLWQLYKSSKAVRVHIDRAIAFYNSSRWARISQRPLYRLLQKQLFRLVHFKTANRKINYRRFFYLNDYIGLRAEQKQVFGHTHRFIFDAVKAATFTGLRIDHIDGVADPAEYLRRLRRAAKCTYIVVEKILDLDEPLRCNWPVQGTSGYIFGNYLNGIFCRQKSAPALTEIYNRFIRRRRDPEKILYENKKLVLKKYLAGEINYLVHLVLQTPAARSFSVHKQKKKLQKALLELVAAFDVYRTYIDRRGCNAIDRDYIGRALKAARLRSPTLKPQFKLLEKVLLPRGKKPQPANLAFITKFQQLTAPAVAKGFEDTFLYNYNRLVSLNEVGGDPARFGVSLDEFYDFNADRAKNSPHSLNATSTHDTKRGEDVRARINVLSEMPEVWRNKVLLWQKINAGHKKSCNQSLAPDNNDEYLLYQTLIGTFPFDGRVSGQFKTRITDYLVKAAREAKVHSAWLKPDTQYEQGCRDFIEAILDSGSDNAFLRDFLPFQRQIATYGVYNSLSQTLLKLTCPGVPDFYQGSELWDLNLVDPDNRRAVDFTRRAELLHRIRRRKNKTRLTQELLRRPETGEIKLFLTARVLQARHRWPELFQNGDFKPLRVEGPCRDHIIAFSRKYKNYCCVTIASRFLSSIITAHQQPVGEDVWLDTTVAVPDGRRRTWKDAVTGRTIRGGEELALVEVLSELPVALLVPAG